MEEANKKITETVPIFFFIYDLEKEEIEFISPQFYDLAVDIESKDKNPLKRCIHPDCHDLFENFFADLSEKNHYEGSIELKANDQLREIRWLELNTFPVREKNMADVSQVVGHIVNITEKKKAYDLMVEEKEHISNMLNMMAHDLRAPFNRVSMITDLMEGNMSEEEIKKHAVYLGMLRKQGTEAMGLIQRLLRLATLKGEANSLDFKIRDLRKIVERSVKQFSSRIEEKKLNLRLHFPDESVKARIDSILFQQVIENLMSNAMKYTPDGGEINCTLQYQGKYILLSVQDSGIGIPEKHQKDLFRNVYGLRRIGLGGEESTGMGLFICKEIVKMHQGTINVESKEGEGSTFTIILPFPESSSAYY